MNELEQAVLDLVDHDCNENDYRWCEHEIEAVNRIHRLVLPGHYERQRQLIEAWEKAKGFRREVARLTNE